MTNVSERQQWLAAAQVAIVGCVLAFVALPASFLILIVVTPQGQVPYVPIEHVAGCLFPFLLLIQWVVHPTYEEVVSWSSNPMLFTFLHWSILAFANAAVVRYWHVQRSVISAIVLVLASALLTALVVNTFGLKFDHVHN
jgi:hypothetical protein